jgi:hypothetical protein
MHRVLVQYVTGVVASILFSATVAYTQQQLMAAKPAADAAGASGTAVRGVSPSGDLPPLPPAPPGKSTVLGGEIRNIDPVRDQLTLKVFGQKPVKVLFDERTQVYRDGKRIALLALGPSSHASIQTTLDGSNVFAVSIHVLSQAPKGDYQGRVLSYSPQSGELAIEGGGAGEPMKLHLAGDASIVREGQSTFAAGQAGAPDLTKGALVTVQFESDKDGHGVVSRVAILATPGSKFVFGGDISALDLHAGYLVLTDPRNNEDYQIFFDSAQAATIPSLHEGLHVRIAAEYNGVHYVANEITAN